MSNRRSLPIAASLAGAAACAALAWSTSFPSRDAHARQPSAQYDWRRDWEIEEGLSLSIDSEGFRLPTAIAVVPNPGSAPKDPLYFVTELRGAVKVVTNDRTVHTFAEGFVRFRPAKELPAIEGESGLAAICLDPARGYVFVTFVYQDSAGVMRNDIVRFATTPRTFALAPTGRTAFTELLAPWASTVSHQIGSCRVSGEHLFVSVADGRQTRRSQDTTALLGKVLRLTLDGRPAPGNPFVAAPATDSSAPNGSAAVWAYGLRNPFGMTVVDGRPYVADNGSGIDRFMRVEPRQNYLWDGSDRSIALRGDVVITPSVGPAHIEYVGAGAALPARLQRTFYVALSAPHAAGVLGLPYDVGAGHALAPPFKLLRYRGRKMQVVSGIALGADGLYVVPIFPDSSGRSAVLRIAAATDTAAAHPFVLLENKDPQALMDVKACKGCHRIGGSGGAVGPTLDRDSLVARLSARLGSADHERLLAWTRSKLLDPRFDNPNTQMPDPEFTTAEATVVARALIGDDPQAATGAGASGRAKAFLRSLYPRPPRVRHLALFGAMGVAAGTLLGWVVGRRR